MAAVGLGDPVHDHVGRGRRQQLLAQHALGVGDADVGVRLAAGARRRAEALDDRLAERGRVGERRVRVARADHLADALGRARVQQQRRARRARAEREELQAGGLDALGDRLDEHHLAAGDVVEPGELVGVAGRERAGRVDRRPVHRVAEDAAARRVGAGAHDRGVAARHGRDDRVAVRRSACPRSGAGTGSACRWR